MSGASPTASRCPSHAGRNGPFLFGVPRKNRPTWTILAADTPDGRGARRLKVLIDWR